MFPLKYQSFNLLILMTLLMNLIMFNNVSEIMTWMPLVAEIKDNFNEKTTSMALVAEIIGYIRK